MPWLIYQFLYSLLLLFGPTLATYVLFEAVDGDKEKLLLGLLPICLGLISLYLWIHVKIHFDQLTKAGRQVRPVLEQPPAAASSTKPQNSPNGPMTITVLAPYPPYDKNYSIYDSTGEVQFYKAPPGPTVVADSKNTMMKAPATPMVQPPTPAPPASP